MNLVPYLAARANAARMDREGERLAWPFRFMLRTLAYLWLACVVVFVGAIGYALIASGALWSLLSVLLIPFHT